MMNLYSTMLQHTRFTCATGELYECVQPLVINLSRFLSISLQPFLVLREFRTGALGEISM